MKRKRFKKLLMGLGTSRNLADALSGMKFVHVGDEITRPYYWSNAEKFEWVKGCLNSKEKGVN